ncbi:MAG: TPM domain-containing protein, partial [Deltaproteobacteria bacterium]|nr:TPM domain-containing protein [Deltaproteobacteria bacterium]
MVAPVYPAGPVPAAANPNETGSLMPMPRTTRESPAVHACKLIVLLALCLILPGPAAAQRSFPEPRGPVNDFANVIPLKQEQQIEAVTGELYRKTGIPVVVVTMPDIGGDDYNEYANRLYEAWGIGGKGEDKGVLLFVTVEERKMRIEVGYGTEGVIPDGLAGQIRDQYMVPYLKKDRYGEGLLMGAAAVAQILAESEGVELTGQVPAASGTRTRKSRSGGFAFFPIILIVLFLLLSSRRRGGSGAWLLLPLLLGGGGRMGGGGGGGFGGL